MAKIKTKEEIEVLREGGRHLAAVLKALIAAVRPGVSARALNDLAEEKIREFGDEPAFLNYTPYGASRPYPATLCVSVNDEVVHGIPNESEKTLKEGDIVSLDIGLKHKGLFVDMAKTVGVGKVSDESQKLMNVTEESLERAIAVCRSGAELNDIGNAIEKYVRPFGYGIVEDLGGHGVGHKVHEPPYIHNYAVDGKSEKLKEGMVLALEPMLNAGTEQVTLDADGYTYKTADGKRSAHFEHTILITKKGAEIITKE
jgi:methionyl aminopeptidase